MVEPGFTPRLCSLVTEVLTTLLSCYHEKLETESQQEPERKESITVSKIKRNNTQT